MWKITIEIAGEKVGEVIKVAGELVGVSSAGGGVVTGASWTFEVEAADYSEAVSESLRRLNAELAGADQVEALLDGGPLLICAVQAAARSASSGRHGADSPGACAHAATRSSSMSGR